jgi:lipoprotein-anchoring transpeptidase ErfK/SrfK
MRHVWLAFVLSLLVISPAHSQARGRAPHRTVQAAKKIDPAAVNEPNQPRIAQGAKGPAVLRAQILLSRAHFSCGELDASFGTNLQNAAKAFQQDRGLPVTGTIDAATWTALSGDTAPAMATATIAPEDVQGPFLPISGDLMKQADLPALGFTSPLEMLSERFHASPAIMQALNPDADFSVAGQVLNVPNALTLPPATAARIVVSANAVRALDADGKLLAYYSATTGSEHDPLPIGEWKINGVARSPKFHYNASLFWDAKNTDDKATLQPGPNNPVGVVWIDLSKDHYGIHGTPEPSLVGHAQSHGCIRLTNWDALELASIVKPGTPATLQE